MEDLMWRSKYWRYWRFGNEAEFSDDAAKLLLRRGTPLFASVGQAAN
jgi:hypothetical protein